MLDQGEQCDDGNPFSGDGCSSSCLLEDPDIWLCHNATGNVGPTTCCRAYLNPVTNNKTCSCQGQASNSSLYTISPTCQKLDVDECGMQTHNCNENAVCNNLNGGLTGATSGFECVCPPGLIGDGVSECQLYAYITRFTVENPSISAASFNEQQFKTLLIESTVIPSNISLDRISLQVQDNSGGGGGGSRRSLSIHNVQKKVQELRSRRRDASPSVADILPAIHNSAVTAPKSTKAKYSPSGRRQLLQAEGSGITVLVSVASLTAEEQNMMTASINTTLLESYGYQTVLVPYNAASDTEVADDPIGTVSGGFQVVSVQYNDTDSR